MNVRLRELTNDNFRDMLGLSLPRETNRGLYAGHSPASIANHACSRVVTPVSRSVSVGMRADASGADSCAPATAAMTAVTRYERTRIMRTQTGSHRSRS